jgi:hypothetical protein
MLIRVNNLRQVPFFFPRINHVYQVKLALLDNEFELVIHSIP